MNIVMKLIIDHREASSENACPCNEERCLRVKVAALSEVGMCDQPIYDEQEQWVKNDDDDTLALFLTCESCPFFDFANLI